MNTRLRELRLEKGLRQKDVAEKIGVCTASYGFYENWVNKPDPETLVKLAALYDVSIDYLLGITDDFGARTTAPTGEVFSSEEKKLVEDYRTLNFACKKLVKQTIETLKNSSNSKSMAGTEEAQ